MPCSASESRNLVYQTQVAYLLVSNRLTLSLRLEARLIEQSTEISDGVVSIRGCHFLLDHRLLDVMDQATKGLFATAINVIRRTTSGLTSSRHLPD